MKIEVGDYVRTKNDGIQKVEFIENSYLGKIYTLSQSHYMEFLENTILKSSKNIIDLIEVGDYVNGLLVENIYKKCKDKLFCHQWNQEIMFEMDLDDINSIVTKEQFSSVEYKIEK